MSIQIPSKTKIVLSVLHEDDQVGQCGGQKGGDQLPVHLSRKRIWKSKCSQVKYYRKEPRSRNNGVLSQACDVEMVQLGENM